MHRFVIDINIPSSQTVDLFSNHQNEIFKDNNREVR
jgi:hypothetical protein